MSEFIFDNRRPMPSGWNPTRILLRGRLTDRRISQYQKRGWYSEDFKSARRDLMQRKAAKRAVRTGSFLSTQDGRLIYSPM